MLYAIIIFYSRNHFIAGIAHYFDVKRALKECGTIQISWQEILIRWQR